MKIPGFYSLVLDDTDAIAEAWMPFLAPGGLWVRARREHALGEAVVLLVQLPGGYRKSVEGRVAWIDPESLSGSAPRKAGIALEGSEGLELAERLRQLAGDELDPAQALLNCSGSGL